MTVAPSTGPRLDDAPALITLDNARILHGDALTALRTLPDNSVDAVITDPPYGLSKEPDPVEVLTHWLHGDDYTHTGRGFMGNTWDSFVPGPSVWREAFRVLKPGGYAAVFASSRTIDLTTIALRLAGFEVRDTLMWHHSQGFPKSLDVAKALTKAGHDDLAATYAGFGTALKPGHEPIALVRKPLVGTVVANVVAHGTGGLNIDATRTGAGQRRMCGTSNRDGKVIGFGTRVETSTSAGRWPANVLFSHADDCTNPSAETGTETATAAGCVAGCPVAELDTQSGIRTSGKPGTYKGTPNRSAAYGAESREAGRAMTGFGDTGGASRFYPTFRYAAKATSKERATVWVPTPACVAAGHAVDPHDPTTDWQAAAAPEARTCAVCAEPWVTYQHATVKPVAVMDWLNTLLCPPGGTVLDPFAGTGTTGVSAVEHGFDPILIERDPVHVAMIHKRLHNPSQTALFGDL